MVVPTSLVQEKDVPVAAHERRAADSIGQTKHYTYGTYTRPMRYV